MTEQRTYLFMMFRVQSRIATHPSRTSVSPPLPSSPHSPHPYPFTGPITGHALDPYTGASVLVEGNYFIDVKQPLIADGGSVYAPLSSSDGSACQSALGRACVANSLLNSGSLSAKNTAAISVRRLFYASQRSIMLTVVYGVGRASSRVSRRSARRMGTTT